MQGWVKQQKRTPCGGLGKTTEKNPLRCRGLNNFFVYLFDDVDVFVFAHILQDFRPNGGGGAADIGRSIFFLFRFRLRLRFFGFRLNISRLNYAFVEVAVNVLQSDIVHLIA